MSESILQCLRCGRTARFGGPGDVCAPCYERHGDVERLVERRIADTPIVATGSTALILENNRLTAQHDQLQSQLAEAVARAERAEAKNVRLVEICVNGHLTERESAIALRAAARKGKRDGKVKR